MARNIKTCFIFSTCLLIFLPGFVCSEEEKATDARESTEKVKIEKKLMQKPTLVFPWPAKEYSMKIITPNLNLDPEIVKNITEPGTEYSMNIIDPYTKRNRTGYIDPSFGLCPNKFK